jgi:hypothetical protein
MARLFTVTTATETPSLDARGHGVVAFTVSNTRPGPLRGRGLVVPLNGAKASWFRVEGDEERDFEAGGTQQFTVRVAVPPGTPPGKGGLRLDVVSVANPDEDFSEGPAVAFEVRPAAPRTFPLWIPAAAAALLVAAAGVVIWLATRYPAEPQSTGHKAPPDTPKAADTPKAVDTPKWDERFPRPPFDLSRYPIEPVTAQSRDEWARRLFGKKTWVLDMKYGGRWDEDRQCMESVQYKEDAPMVKGRPMVVEVYGPKRDISCVSYICVGGPGAEDVDVACIQFIIISGKFVTTDITKYRGWNGSVFADVPAVPHTVADEDYYWYRLDVRWAWSDRNTNFIAFTSDRHKGSSPPRPFKLWAFKHSN